jgi:hypothetical protein
MSGDNSHSCEVALGYARAGLAVFPCNQDKKPLVTSWLNTATTDKQQISAWWQQWPAALIGLPLKQINCLVIDADRHSPDEDGVAQLRALCEGKELPSHPVVLTANNGEHHFFKQPSGEKIGNKKFGIGLETRGFKLDNDGGYVIAVGSRLSDGRCWQLRTGSPRLSAMLANGGLPEAPQWLIELIIPQPKGGGHPGGSNVLPGREARHEAYADKALAGCVEELARAQPGERNNVLNAVAFRMGTMIAREWIEKSTVADALWRACERNGLVRDDGADSVRKTLASGLAAGLSKPHDDLPDRTFSGERQGEAQRSTNTDEAIDTDEEKISALAELSEPAYQKRRIQAAKALGMRVIALDKLVRKCRAKIEENAAVLPHWNVEPSQEPVNCATLLVEIERTFTQYIMLPKGAGVALALWTLHAWTVDAGDISPFLVLVSPTKRCGKTNTLIILFYLTPRSELASNISSSALFRYIEETHPTLLIDEADSFVKDNEEMRGILNSGQTRAAAHVIRNVEVNGEHKPRRFSTWGPKAIATIRSLADTLEDRSVVLQLQRKSRAASVARLRRRDNEEFASLRSRAARWAADNFSKLTDPDPDIPNALNDRAADNWRPLLAIADLAGGAWPKRAQDAACLLSGEGHDSTSVNVELLADIRLAFAEADVVRSTDLVEKLIADPERPWAEWRHGKPLTQKQLAGLLRPFGIISEEVHPPGQTHGKGYKRVRFEEAWEAYLPGQNLGQNACAHQIPTSEARNRASPDGMGISSDFRSARETIPRGSKNANLSYSHAGLRACADRKPGNGARVHSDHENGAGDFPDSLRRCAQCNAPGDARGPVVAHDDHVWLHRECRRFWLKEHSQ